MQILDIFNPFITNNLKLSKKWDVFLSHKQFEAQDRAKLYKCSLEKYKIKAFYDKDELTDNDWSIEKVIEVVCRSKNFIFFLTPTILDNPWCQLELYIAIVSKIKIYILVVEPALWTDKHIDINKINIPTYLKPAFKKNNIIIDYRYNFDNLIKKIAGKIKK